MAYTYNDHYEPGQTSRYWFDSDEKEMRDQSIKGGKHYKPISIAIVNSEAGKIYALGLHEEESKIMMNSNDLGPVNCSIFKDPRGRFYFCICQDISGGLSRVEDKSVDPKYDWFRAISQAAVQLLGPLGAPMSFLLSLYDDKRAKEREGKVFDLIKSKGPIEIDSLEEIFDPRPGLEKNRLVFLELIASIINHVRMNLVNLEKPHLFQPKGADILPYASARLSIFTSEAVVSELRKIFSKDNITALKTIARQSGFLADEINWDQSYTIVISDFVDRCQWEEIEVLSNLFSKISKEYEGAENLRELALLLEEASANKKD